MIRPEIGGSEGGEGWLALQPNPDAKLDAVSEAQQSRPGAGPGFKDRRAGFGWDAGREQHRFDAGAMAGVELMIDNFAAKECLLGCHA